MKTVFISDTHMHHPNVPEGDVLIHAGDLLSHGYEVEFVKEIEWLGSLPHKRKFYVPGNHDRCVEKSPQTCKDFASDEGVDLVIDETREIEDITFFFSPWSLEFGYNWAYNQKPEGDQRYWDNAPNCRILVVHGAPYNVLDQCPNTTGSKGLLSYINRVQPELCVFGHIHEHGGECQFVNRTLCYNASIVDYNYNLLNDGKMFDL